MTMSRIYDINNNQIVIELPKTFLGKKKVMVTINDIDEKKDQKNLIMKHALNDPLFVADLNEVNDDFSAIDNENWK